MNLFSHSFKATSKLLTIIILLTFSFVNAQFISMSGHVHSVQINGVILPLAGAVVQIDGIDAQAASDSSGYYELSFLWNWNGPITAQCSAEGFETATETFFPESDNIVRNFTLYPIPDNMTHLQGHVRQMECDNCPIPGALISAFNINSPTDEIYSTYSGENGHYILPLPLTPDYGFIWSVTVQHPDFQSQTVELEIGPGGADHLFLLAPNDPAPTIGVYGYVSAPSPNGMMIPVPGALITVWSVDISDEVYTTESGDNGYYELEFGPGEYTLTCTKNGFVPFETSFWVGNVPVHLPIILQPAPFEENLVFSGIVMGALGGMLPAYGPLSGAHVEVFGGDDPTFVSVDTYTDAEGHFSFFVDDSLHGFPVFQEALVRVSSPGFIMQEIWLNFYDWPVFHDFYLETIPSEDVFLSGTVFGPSSDDPSINLPLEGAHLRIYGGFSGGLLAEFITGDDGYYQFGDVVTAAYAIEIIAEGFISQEHSLPGYGGNYPMELDFTLLPDENMLPYIAGHVYSADSADINIIIPGAFLQLRGFADDEIIEETLSDESGYYQFMVNGLFIDVSAFGYISQTVEVPQIDCGPANSRCWPIELDIYLQPDEVPPPTGIIFGMVSAQLSPMGPVFPVIGATVSAAPLWGGQEWISTETDNNGEYLLEVWAGDITWVVTCETEFGVHSEQVVVPPNEEVSVNFHFNVWEEPQIPAPFDLTAEPGINDSGNLVVFLNWQYPPEPDPDIQTEFHVFLIPPDNSDWIMVGGTLEHSFVFVLDGGPPNHPLCFAVRATSQGMVSEPSNVACAEFQEPDCFDLSDIDFGPCDMVLGAGWNGNECIWISGCSMESGGVDYSPYFFDSVEGCVDSCMDPPQNGTVFGWVTAQFSPEGPTVPIAGAVVQAVFPNGNDSLATVVTEENGHYAMTLPANNNGYLITCTTEYGVQTHMVSLPPGGEVQVDFHWNTWIPDIPAPFDLIAEYDPNIPSWGGVVLQWQYPPMPDPTQVPVFHVLANFIDPDGEWTEVGTTGEMMFIYHLTGFWNPPEMCFVVTATINGETSEWSNMACVQTEPQECFDLSGIDFGDCEMVLGIGWNGYECILISGCGWIVDGVDYSPYFFETMDECTAECGGPPSETAVLYGTVNYLWGDAVELIAGAQIVAMNEMGMIYETFSDDYGGYELQMIAGTYEVSCSLPDSGETQSQTVTIEAGDMQVLDFWFGEPVEQYALFGMVYGETASGEAVPMDGAQIVVYYSGTVLETYSTEGAYWISLPEPGEYQVAVNAEGYIGIEEVINISGLTEMDFFLQPLDIGMLVVHLNVGSATAMPGDTVAIPIFVETEHPVGGIQFTLTDVPDHVTAIGYLSHMECFSASFNDVDGSAITIFFSPGGCTIDPGTIDFAHLVYAIDSSAPPGGIIELIPVDVIISNPDGEPMEYITQPGSITLGLLGDVNMDSDINVLDIVNLVNFILLMDDPTDYELFAGDINGDGELNVLDVVQLVNLIIGPPGRTNDSGSSSVHIHTGDHIVSIMGSGIGGFQLTAREPVDLTGWDLPNGWEVRLNGNRLVAYTTDESINGSAELHTSNGLTLETVLFSDRYGNRLQTITGMLPERVILHPNYPNPFNPVTTIAYELPAGDLINLTVFDMTGKQVEELVNGYQSAGIHTIEFNGNELSSGIYVITLNQGDQIQSQKVLLLK